MQYSRSLIINQQNIYNNKMGPGCSILCDCSDNLHTDKMLGPYSELRKPQRDSLSSNSTGTEDSDRYAYFQKFSSTNIKEVFTFEKMIGDGHFGSVYIAHLKWDISRKYAIKTLEKSKISDRSLKRLESELEILETLDHPNLVKYHATFVDK